MRRLAGLVLLAAAAACAQPGSPPGGEIDRFPPRVIATSPEAFDTITDLSRPVEIRFDERLSERFEGVTDLEDAVLVSPRTGVVQVERGRRSLKVSLAGGWKPDLVYRVHVRPVFRDLFQNLRAEPVELVFSTGGPIHETALAGFVADRLTGKAVEGARIEAVRRIDGGLYEAVTDSAGFFAMRYVPAGAYDVRGWLDQDRDGAPDFFEPQDSSQATIAFGDTLVMEAALLPGDTTPARLARVEPLDSTTLELLFDDYFAPGPVAGNAQVVRFGDSTLVTAGTLLHGSRLDSLRAARRAAADSAAAEAADTARVDPEAAGAAPPGRPGNAGPGRAGALPATPPLPARELILLLPEPLRPDSVYYVAVDGVTNIHGLTGGGGSARFEMPPAPPPDTVPADSAALRPDSLGAPPDTTPRAPLAPGR